MSGLNKVAQSCYKAKYHEAKKQSSQQSKGAPGARFPFAVKGRSVEKKPNVPASSQAGLAQVDMAFHGRGSGVVDKP